MALLTWPAAIDDLKFENASFRLRRQREVSRAGDGTPYSKELGPAIWAADVQSIPYLHSDAEAIMALLEAMEDEVGCFYLYNPAVPYPIADPDGSTFGSSTPTILSVNADGRRFAIQGLPDGYVLTRGDKVAVDYTSPAKRALYAVVDEKVTADSSGETAQFQVSPPIRIGLSAGDAVYLIKPSAIMRIDPGTLACKTETAVTSRVVFTATEDPKAEVA